MTLAFTWVAMERQPFIFEKNLPGGEQGLI
jgi:hypothetical protein